MSATRRSTLLLFAILLPASVLAATATMRVTVSPRARDWPHAPVRVALDSALRAAGWTGLILPDAVVVREGGRIVPHRRAWSAEGEDGRTIVFAKTGIGRRTYEITVAAQGDTGTRQVPVVGLGEPMSHGRTGIVASIDGSFNSHLAIADWDGDGDIDFFIGHGLGGGATWTMHGLQYHENAGGARAPLMAKPVWLAHSTGMPHVVDWDGDGDRDVVSGTTLYRAEGGRGALVFRPDTMALADVPAISHLADWDGDGRFDIIRAISIGGGDPSPATWSKDLPVGPFTSEGVWRGYDGHGMILVHRNTGASGGPRFSAAPETLRTEDGAVIDVVTGGDPALGDLDGDGDLDLLVGNRFDLYWFENDGTRCAPRFRRGIPLDFDLAEIYIRPLVADMNGDGRADILVSHEGGDIRWLENRGAGRDGLPAFEPPATIPQRDPFIDTGSVGAFDLADMDGDARLDILGGNSYGEAWLWLATGDAPWTFGAGRRVSAGGRPIRIYAGASGSIQGPGEARYGYVAPETADWDGDGTRDFFLADVWGRHRFYRGLGMRDGLPAFAAAEPLRFGDPRDARKPVWNWWEPEDGELVTQWRIRPEILDADGDGVTDYVAIDHEGVLALFPGVMTGAGKRLGTPRRIFRDDSGAPLVLNDGANGRSGRHKICLADWDGDGDRDLIRSVAEPAGNRIMGLAHERGCAFLWECIGTDPDGGWRFAFRGEMIPDPEIRLAGHSTCPQAHDIDGDGMLDLLIGAEDGHIYAFHRAYLEGSLPLVRIDRVRVMR